MLLHEHRRSTSTTPLDHFISLLPPKLRTIFRVVPSWKKTNIEEVRVHQNQPIVVTFDEGDRFVTPRGLATTGEKAFVPDEATITSFLDTFTRSSVYAVEEAMKEGYLTLPGGHRAGIVGSLRLKDGQTAGYRYVVGFTIRLNRPVYGIGARVVPFLLDDEGKIRSTLIVSPPRCGKTTLLRDIVRTLSYGDARRGIRPHRIGIADERGEIAASHKGIPQNDLGPRVDVIDQCPKRFALTMLLRATGPEVLVTDEVGHPGDEDAVVDAAGAGVRMLCTMHGDDMTSLRRRRPARSLLESGLFSRIVLLSRRRGPGTIECIVDNKEGIGDGYQNGGGDFTHRIHYVNRSYDCETPGS